MLYIVILLAHHVSLLSGNISLYETFWRVVPSMFSFWKLFHLLKQQSSLNLYCNIPFFEPFLFDLIISYIYLPCIIIYGSTLHAYLHMAGEVKGVLVHLFLTYPRTTSGFGISILFCGYPCFGVRKHSCTGWFLFLSYLVVDPYEPWSPLHLPTMIQVGWGVSFLMNLVCSSLPPLFFGLCIPLDE